MKQELIDMSIQTIKPKEGIRKYYVYVIHHPDYEEFYIGQTGGPKDRLHDHQKNTLVKGKPVKWTMEILAIYSNRREAMMHETDLIDMYKCKTEHILNKYGNTNIPIYGKQLTITEIQKKYFSHIEVGLIQTFVKARKREGVFKSDLGKYFETNPEKINKKSFNLYMNTRKALNP